MTTAPQAHISASMRKAKLTPKGEPKSFADELYEWRKARGWTQRRAAEYLGCTLSSIENWEQGRKVPKTPITVQRAMSTHRLPKKPGSGEEAT